MADSVYYKNDIPWPTEADGSGCTLELINPDYNNTIADYWVVSNEYGTPGKVNYYFTEIPFKNFTPITNKIELYQNFPNPFSSSTTIQFRINTSQTVRLFIYNSSGQVVKVLIDNYLTSGLHHLIWNGQDENNNILPDGIYFYRIEADNLSIIKKAILIK